MKYEAEYQHFIDENEFEIVLKIYILTENERILIKIYRKYREYVYGRCQYRSSRKNKEYLRSEGKAENDMMYQDI